MFVRRLKGIGSGPDYESGLLYFKARMKGVKAGMRTHSEEVRFLKGNARGRGVLLRSRFLPRVPAVYLSSALLAILANPASCRITNLRVVSTQ